MADSNKQKSPSFFKRFKRGFKKSNEDGARKNVIEELFYDFNRSRAEVYKINFVRGLFFGVGSVLGGTVVIALIVWILSILGNFIPPLGDAFDALRATIQSAKR